MKRRNLLLLITTLVALVPVSLHAQSWKPSKPVTIIVPWAAGGSTDQVTRITAAELEKHLGQKVVIVNQPGASGSIGTKSALEAPKDGHTWTAGAAQDLGVYRALGMLETNLADWHLFLSVANVPLVGVNPNTPYKTMKEISRATGVKYRHVTYDGGNPAVVATVAGETQVTTQLAVEQAEMIRGKRLRPLAAVADKPLEIEGFGRIEAITQTLPGMKIPTNYFGIFIPKGVPPAVVATVDRIWGDHITRSEALKKYATSRGALFAPMSGQDAQKAALPAVQANAGVLEAGGRSEGPAGPP